MRSSVYRRRARANDLRIFVRDDVPKIPGDPDLSDSDDEDGPDGPDSPSPTSPDFPPPPQVGDPTQQPAVTSSEPISSSSSSTTDPVSSQPTTLTSSVSVSVTPSSSISVSITQSAESQNTDVVQAQASQAGNSVPNMGRGGTIAFGTIGAVVIVAAIAGFIWWCRRRRNRGKGGLFGSTSSSGFEKMEEPRRPVTADYGSSRDTSSRNTQSRMMDNLMAAAYAAEDGNASQYGTYTGDKRQSNTTAFPGDARQPTPMRQSSTNSLYVNQLLSGFYKGQRADGLTAPPNARMPPPAAPSVAGRTEVTATSESTWRTWGWSQPKQQQPKEGWIDKCIRLGGLR
ncbi:hypothetical protein F4805DRAFT_160067 [Annulohypoxylon moriforme]|nr:hypothetical protein F4805DRAFT_160067 [Annulohypoxylon moriforme]